MVDPGDILVYAPWRPATSNLLELNLPLLPKPPWTEKEDPVRGDRVHYESSQDEDRSGRDSQSGSRDEELVGETFLATGPYTDHSLTFTTQEIRVGLFPPS